MSDSGSFNSVATSDEGGEVGRIPSCGEGDLQLAVNIPCMEGKGILSPHGVGRVLSFEEKNGDEFIVQDMDKQMSCNWSSMKDEIEFQNLKQLVLM